MNPSRRSVRALGYGGSAVATSVLDQAANRYWRDVAGRRSGLRKGKTDVMSIAKMASASIAGGMDPVVAAPKAFHGSPCDGWDVRSLLSHLVGTLALGEALLSDSMPSVPMEPGGVPAGDVLGDDPIKAYRTRGGGVARRRDRRIARAYAHHADG